MSSEYSIHLGDKPIEGTIANLNPDLPCMVVRLKVDDDHSFLLYVKDDRWLEVSLLFQKIAQDLAALLDVDIARCRGEGHQECIVHDQCQVDAIPIEEAAEHVEPPHRWD